MDWLHFLNLQYWYCLIYSALGGHCAALDAINASRPDVPKGEAAFTLFFRGIASTVNAIWQVIGDIALAIWNGYSALAFVYSGFIGLAILWVLFSLAMLRLTEAGTYGTLPPARAKPASAATTEWQALLEDAMSTDPKRWKSAILTADEILGSLLGRLGYQGTGTGERMQRLPDDAFRSVAQAWEAHRIKNFVSAGSSDYVLTQREAYRVMKLYEDVFEELGYL